MVKVESVYPITTTKYPDGTEKTYITDEDLKNFTKPEELDSLYDYLRGSTRYIEGVYLVDVEGWLNNRPNLD